MYNEEFKKAYFETLTKQQEQRMKTIFNASEGIESLYEKDLCRFTYTEFYYLFKTNKWSNSFQVYKSNIKSYVLYAISNGESDSASLENLSALSFEALDLEDVIKENYYSSPEHLRKELYSFLKLTDGYNKLFFICYYELAFIGIEECVNIRTYDINEDDNTICENGKVFQIPEEFREDIYEFKNYDINVSDKRGAKQKLVDNDKLFKLVKRAGIDEAGTMNIMRKISKINSAERKNVDISVKQKKWYRTNIVISGKFYKMYNYLLEHPTDTIWYAMNLFGSRDNIDKKNYEIWVKVFYS